MDSREQATRRIAILVVEDDPAALDIVMRVLAMQFPDARIHSAQNGLRGEELFKEHAPDIVITDIGMPVKDGVAMTREIKSLKADTRFIVLTAYNDLIFLKQFREMGVDNYLLKPVDLDKLMAAVQECIDEVGAAAGNDPEPPAGTQ